MGMDALTRCGRCSRCSTRGRTPSGATSPRQPRPSATSASWTSPHRPGPEGLAAAAVVFAVAGSERPTVLGVRAAPTVRGHAMSGHRRLRLLPRSGRPSPRRTGRRARRHHPAEAHFRAALAMHERLGAAGWTRLHRAALAELAAAQALPARNEFRRRTAGGTGIRRQTASSRTPRDYGTSRSWSKPKDATFTSDPGRRPHPLPAVRRRPGAGRPGESGVQGPAGEPRRRHRPGRGAGTTWTGQKNFAASATPCSTPGRGHRTRRPVPTPR